MRVRALPLFVAVVTLVLSATVSIAQDRPSLKAGTLSAARGLLRLDGHLDEEAWSTADSIANLTTIEPEEGQVPTQRTVVRVLVDPGELWIGVRCFDEPGGIISFSKARDVELDEEDNILIVLDPFGDERSGYVFAVNPTGSRLDGLVTAQGDDVNANWNAVWEAKTSTDSSGWSAEIRLPIKSLSFKRGLTQWGFNIERRVQRLQESSRWSGAKRDYEIFQTTKAGLLTDLPAFDLGLGLTVRPSLVFDNARPDPESSRETTVEGSLDATQKLGSNLAATLTVNTDFGEAEADVRQTSLTRFDLLFPEKREFFLEGADIFEFGVGTNLEDANLLPFYSRTIGIYVPEGEDPSAGQTVPIIAGGKLNGRVGETNMGALAVATDAVDDSLPPAASMGVVRLRQNVFSESSLGVIATYGDPLDRQNAWSAGTDFTFRTSSFREDKNLVAGIWGLTNDREGLTGSKQAAGGKIAYPNELWDASLTYFWVGDGFQPSLGFVQRRGHILQSALEFNPRPNSELLRKLTFAASYFLVRDQSGSWESYLTSIKPLSALFESGDRIEARIEPQGEQPAEAFDVFDSPSTTVEILPGAYHWTRYVLAGTLAPKRKVSAELSYAFGGFYDGDLQTFEGNLLIKPGPIATLQLIAERNVGTLPEGDFTQYLYSSRLELKVSPEFQISSFIQYDNESRSLGSATRARWTFHPLGDLFLAFNRNMIKSYGTETDRWEFESDQFLVKVQYAFRL